MPIDPELSKAVAKAIQGVWINGARRRISDEYASLLAEAAITLVMARCAEAVGAQAGLLAMASDDYDAGWHAAITVAVDAIRALAPQEPSR